MRARISVVGPTNRFDAKLNEDIINEDVPSDSPYRNHTFNAYGATGNVTGELVYANYGRVEDFDTLYVTVIDISARYQMPP